MISTIRKILLCCFRTLSFYFRDSFRYPFVSVVLTVRNEERYIDDCLKSVQSQSYKNFECIIVDDASTDRSCDIIDALISKDKRFALIRLQDHQGLPEARNRGLFASKGTYISFIDGDDFLLPHSLWHRVYSLKKNQNPNAAGSFCHRWLVGENRKYNMTAKIMGLWLPNFQDGWIDFLTVKGECPFAASGPLMKTAVVKTCGGFRGRKNQEVADWDLWYRILRNGYIFIASPNTGFAYRQKRNGMIHSASATHTRNAMHLIEKAYHPVERQDISENPPYIFRAPLYEYDKAVKKMNRIIIFLTMAYMKGDIQEAHKILADFVGPYGNYLYRHLDINESINKGLERYQYAFSHKMPKKETSKKRKEVYQRILQTIEKETIKEEIF